ncbi:MAG: hypothetical protein U0136_21190 [Bdellovibrionota bacterium]
MKKGTKKTTPPKDETKPAKTRKKARPDCPPSSDPVAAPPESSRPQPSASGQPETPTPVELRSPPDAAAPVASRSWTALCKAVSALEGVSEGAALNPTTVLDRDLLRPLNGKVAGRVHGTREQDIQLDLVEIAMDLEDELGVSVPDSMLEQWLGRTLGAICQELERIV